MGVEVSVDSPYVGNIYYFQSFLNIFASSGVSYLLFYFIYLSIKYNSLGSKDDAHL